MCVNACVHVCTSMLSTSLEFVRWQLLYISRNELKLDYRRIAGSQIKDSIPQELGKPFPFCQKKSFSLHGERTYGYLWYPSVYQSPCRTPCSLTITQTLVKISKSTPVLGPSLSPATTHLPYNLYLCLLLSPSHPLISLAMLYSVLIIFIIPSLSPDFLTLAMSNRISFLSAPKSSRCLWMFSLS